jgi:hypothetical protein
MSQKPQVIHKMVKQYIQFAELWNDIIRKRMIRLETVQRKILRMQLRKNERGVERLLQLEKRKSQSIHNFPNDDELLVMAIHSVLRCQVSYLSFCPHSRSPYDVDPEYCKCCNRRYNKNDTPIHEYVIQCREFMKSS